MADKNAARPRLCHLRRWPEFNGYGFNLHSEKVRPGQYIGKVDPNSPAESAGLRENDRIIEVNHVPIGTENHKQVVARIKEGVTRNGTKYTEEVILLVVDQKTDDYYKSRSLVPRSSDENVIKLETEIRHDSENGSDSPHSSTRSVERTEPYPTANVVSSPSKSNEYDGEYKNVTGQTNTSSPAISRTSDNGYHASEEREPHHQYSPPILRDPIPQEPPSATANSTISALAKASPPIEDPYPRASSTHSSAHSSKAMINLDMSAAQYREKLQSQPRKYDPRQNQQMSMKEKRAYIDGM